MDVVEPTYGADIQHSNLGTNIGLQAPQLRRLPGVRFLVRRLLVQGRSP